MERVVGGSRIVLVALIVMHSSLAIVGFFFFKNNYIAPHEIGFGFGDYVANILSAGKFQSCDTRCSYASRMPIFPLLAAASFSLLDSLTGLMLAKTVLFATAILVLLWSVWPRLDHLRVALITLLLLNPLLIKHMFTPHYEEFLVANAMILYALALAGLPEGSLTAQYWVLAILSAFLYLTKMTYIPILLLTVYLVLLHVRRKWHMAFMLLTMTSAVFAWSVHMHEHGGQKVFGSSFDGLNLYEAVLPFGTKIYPRITPDRLLDTTDIIDIDGAVVHWNAEESGFQNRDAFASEWEWDAYYGKLSYNTILHHPLEVMKFTVKKIWYAVAGLHDKLRDPLDAERWTFVLPIFLALRLISIAASMMVVQCWSKLDKRERTVLLLYPICTFCPFIVGFAYERHLTGAVSAISLAAIVLSGRTASHTAANTSRWGALFRKFPAVRTDFGDIKCRGGLKANRHVYHQLNGEH